MTSQIVEVDPRPLSPVHPHRNTPPVECSALLALKRHRPLHLSFLRISARDAKIYCYFWTHYSYIQDDTMAENKEAVIISAARTRTGKFQGALKGFTAPELGAIAIKEAVKRAGVDPAK